MNEFYNTLRKDRILWLSTIIACGLLILACLYIIVFYNSLPPFLPLYNQLSWGEARLGEKPFLFIPIAFSLFILVMNTVLSARVYKHAPLISRMFAITSFLISITTCIFIVRMTQLLL